MSDCISRDFKGIWIPRDIWLLHIPMQAKALWAELDSLNDSEAGGCYASNEYLCNFLQLKERRLYELFDILKEFGLLITVSFDGRRTVRKAIIPPRAEQVCGKVQTSGAEKCTPKMRKSADPPIPPYIDKNKDKNKEERVAAPASLSLSQIDNKEIILNNEISESEKNLQHNIHYQTPEREHLKTKKMPNKPSDKIQPYGKYVLLKPEEYNHLCKEIGKTLVDAYIEKINNYTPNKPKGAYKDYAAAIRQWHIRAKEEGKIKPMSAPENNVDVEEMAKRKKFIDAYIKKNWDKMKTKDLWITNQATFVSIGHVQIFYHDPNFRDKLIKELKRTGYEP